MASYVVCQVCRGQVPRTEKHMMANFPVVSETTGESKSYYVHNNVECIKEYWANKTFRLDESEKKDALNDYVKELYGVKYDLPIVWWEHITDLREGTNRYQKFWQKKYKKGVPFDVIRESFLLSRQDIEWARMTKRFATLEKELRYGLKIIQSKVNDAFRKMKTRDQQDKINLATEKLNIEELKTNREVVFKENEQKKRDYSYLLGND